MSEQELKKLENQIDEIIQTCERLSNENSFLRKQQGALASERAGLIEKNEQARSRVEVMIQRLRSLEEES